MRLPVYGALRTGIAERQSVRTAAGTYHRQELGLYFARRLRLFDCRVIGSFRRFPGALFIFIPHLHKKSKGIPTIYLLSASSAPDRFIPLAFPGRFCYNACGGALDFAFSRVGRSACHVPLYKEKAGQKRNCFSPMTRFAALSVQRSCRSIRPCSVPNRQRRAKGRVI